MTGYGERRPHQTRQGHVVGGGRNAVGGDPCDFVGPRLGLVGHCRGIHSYRRHVPLAAECTDSAQSVRSVSASLRQRSSLIDMRRLGDAPPITQIAVGLYGPGAVLVLRVLTSHLGRTGKEVGVGVAAVLALVVDPLLLRYFRRRLDGGNDAE